MHAPIMMIIINNFFFLFFDKCSLWLWDVTEKFCFLKFYKKQINENGNFGDNFGYEIGKGFTKKKKKKIFFLNLFLKIF